MFVEPAGILILHITTEKAMSFVAEMNLAIIFLFLNTQYFVVFLATVSINLIVLKHTKYHARTTSRYGLL